MPSAVTPRVLPDALNDVLMQEVCARLSRGEWIVLGVGSLACLPADCREGIIKTYDLADANGVTLIVARMNP